MGDDSPWLHIRSQFTYHFEASIRGTRDGLTALRDAINDALENGIGECAAVASDGEVYEVEVVRCSTIAQLGKPTYLDAEARELVRREYEFLTRQYRNNRPIEKEMGAALRWCRANGNPHLDATP